MKLTTLTLTWQGTEYYCVNVRLSHWNYEDNRPTWQDMQDWCEGIFGPQGDPWMPIAYRWYINDSKFWFREERNRTLFMLRWS